VFLKIKIIGTLEWLGYSTKPDRIAAALACNAVSLFFFYL